MWAYQNMRRTELCRLRPLLSEMLMSTCLQYAQTTSIISAVGSNAIIQHSVHQIPHYVHVPTSPRHLCTTSTVLMKRARCHALFALKPNVSVLQKGTPEVHVRGLLLRPLPPPAT